MKNKPTKEQIEAIKSIIRMGLDFETARMSLEVSDDDAREWIDLDEMKCAIRQAEKQFVVMMVKKIYDDGGAMGAKFLLERSEKAEADDIYG